MNRKDKLFWASHKGALAFTLLLGIFLVYSTWLALNLQRGIIPDEPAHFFFSQHYASTWGIPKDTPETYAQGWYIEQNPYLYYWINARVLNAAQLIVPAISNWQKLVLLRLLSVLYAAGTVIFSYWLSKEFIKSQGWQLLPPFLLTNTLMFVFLSAGVNYDNLANLFSMAGLTFLARVFHRKDYLPNSLACLLSLSLGTLVKYPLLPLALAAGTAWLIFSLKYRKSLVPLRRAGWQTVLLGAGVLVALVANLLLYGVNLMKYQSVTPACLDLLTQAQCEISPYAVRHLELKLDHKLTIAESIELGYPSPLEYVIDAWIPDMLYRIYGILGHLSYFPRDVIIFFRLLFMWLLLLASRYLRRPSFAVLSITGIFLFYALVLLYINYNSELTYGFRQIAVQGRYLFPVMGAAYVLLAYTTQKVQNRTVRWLTLLWILILFFVSGPVKFLLYQNTIFAGWFL
ncbi:MAG: hypothetical protein MUC85_02435 [Anaerolineales bacterium]|jgi:hypothetical protein|nr:hypothetical protein [Anaerolineales bacterium]